MSESDKKRTTMTPDEFRALFLSLSDDKQDYIIEVLERLTKGRLDKPEVDDDA